MLLLQSCMESTVIFRVSHYFKSSKYNIIILLDELFPRCKKIIHQKYHNLSFHTQMHIDKACTFRQKLLSLLSATYMVCKTDHLGLDILLRANPGGRLILLPSLYHELPLPLHPREQPCGIFSVLLACLFILSLLRSCLSSYTIS